MVLGMSSRSISKKMHQLDMANVLKNMTSDKLPPRHFVVVIFKQQGLFPLLQCILPYRHEQDANRQTYCLAYNLITNPAKGFRKLTNGSNYTISALNGTVLKYNVSDYACNDMLSVPVMMHKTHKGLAPLKT